ncbi:hypothetical protein OJF2_20210 [Aquisphaera giovannonii]|uniref:Lipoprotein n=1 Tax=Aquisphaera giovannonii TaxID=406548 RepID=A0A5B9VZU2_9BACT|nr:hypothetical protein OJF2_20210 [Aquisphaera giovannonii]
MSRPRILCLASSSAFLACLLTSGCGESGGVSAISASSYEKATGDAAGGGTPPPAVAKAKQKKGFGAAPGPMAPPPQ